MEEVRKFLLKNIFLIYYLLTILTFVYFSLIKYSKIPEIEYNSYIFYSVVIFMSFLILKILKKDYAEFFGFRLNKITKSFLIYTLITSLVSNIILVLIFCDGKIILKYTPITMISLQSRFFFGAIRALGEEIIFKGFLMSKVITNNKKIFWICNLIQASIFTFIHLYIPFDSLTIKVLFGFYLFCGSIFEAYLNRKFKSIMPSWFVHTLNGIYKYFVII